MTRYVFKMPDLGEGTVEAEIVAWHVKVGEHVDEDQVMAEVMTEKAAVEVPAPVTGRVVALTGQPGDENEVPIGEVDGSITGRTRLVAAALQSMPGFEIEIRTDMDAWLKYHAALLMPSLAAAFYACGEDRIRLAGTRDERRRPGCRTKAIVKG